MLPPMSFSGSASSGASAGPQDSAQGSFFGGSFTAATGGSKATGSPSWITIAVIGLVVIVVIKKWKA